MRFEFGSIAGFARDARESVSLSMIRAAGLGRRSKALFGGVIVAASAGVVATMVASVVLGPLGDTVLARNGDASRGPDSLGGSGGGGGSPAEALPAPHWTQTLSAAPQAAHYRASYDGHGGRSEPRYVAHIARSDSRVASRRVKGEGRRHLAQVSRMRHVADAGAFYGQPLAFANGRPSGTHSVCVRLCDGFFFPVGDVHGTNDLEAQTAVCSNACPGAPTRLYVVPTNERDMTKAASIPDGKPYTALPVAFDHAKEVGPTCTCHAAGQADGPLMSPMRDITMRNGDSVMTPVGWRVFKQTGHWPYNHDNFTSLAEAGKLSPATRSILASLQDASVPHVAPLPPTAILDIRKGRQSVQLRDGDGRLVPEDAAPIFR